MESRANIQCETKPPTVNKAATAKPVTLYERIARGNALAQAEEQAQRKRQGS